MKKFKFLTFLSISFFTFQTMFCGLKTSVMETVENVDETMNLVRIFLIVVAIIVSLLIILWGIKIVDSIIRRNKFKKVFEKQEESNYYEVVFSEEECKMIYKALNYTPSDKQVNGDK